jgi:hypothetical protein
VRLDALLLSKSTGIGLETPRPSSRARESGVEPPHSKKFTKEATSLNLAPFNPFTYLLCRCLTASYSRIVVAEATLRESA